MVQDDNFRFNTDSLRLLQVLSNIIKNAIKFTDEGEINFSYEIANNNELLFKIQDSGIGIPLEKQNEIFNRFSQLKESSHNKIKGTGLGLTISKEIVSLMGGKIWLESIPGQGSTFYFTVPTNI